MGIEESRSHSKILKGVDMKIKVKQSTVKELEGPEFTTTAPQLLHELYQQREDLNERIQKYVPEIIRDLPRLPDDRFWELVDAFKAVLEYSGKEDMYDKVKWGAEEFSRRALVSGILPFWEYMRFTKQYDEMVSKIYDLLFGKIVGGDDHYGDVLDSYPLHGREAYENALKGVVVKGDPYLGENYVVTRLDESLEFWLPNFLSYFIEMDEEDVYMSSMRDGLKGLDDDDYYVDRWRLENS